MRDLLGKPVAAISEHLTLVLVGLPLLITLVLLALGVGIPDDKDTAVIINEISAPAEASAGQRWIELYNNSAGVIDLAGWSIRTQSETVQLAGQLRLGPGGYLVVPADYAAFAQQHPIFAAGAARASQPFKLANAHGSLVLLDTSGQTIDSVAWPQPSKTDQPQIAWVSPPPQESGKTLVRRVVGLDSNQSSDWAAGPASPGAYALPTLHWSTRLVLLEFTNYISLIGGFLLWSAFVLVGLIARRFEYLTGQRTLWQTLLIAPVGILIYNVIQANAFLTRGRMTDPEQLWSFLALLIAAAIMIFAIHRFYRAARRILEV